MKAKNILPKPIRHSAFDAESPAKMRLRNKPAMTKSVLLILCLQCVFTTGSCREKPIPPDQPKPQFTYPTRLEIIWNAPFHSDSIGDYFLEYEMANNQYIVLANMWNREEGKSRGIGVYNMQTGERHPAWQNDPGGIFSVIEVEDLMDCKIAGKNKDIILIYNQRALFGYNLHGGQRIWTLNIPNTGQVKMSADVNIAFITYGPGALSKSWYRLAVIDVYSGTKTDVLELTIEDNYDFDINPPSAYVNSVGDTLLYFTTGGWNFAEVKGRVHAYCYNLTKKQMVWENKQFGIDRDISASQPPPFVIENDKLIVTSLRAIHCLNRLTGELIWQREDVAFADMPPLYYEGKLYIRSRTMGTSCILLCLDAQSGQQLWENTTLSPHPAHHGKMAIYKDRLYFSHYGKDIAYSLACVDAQTGQTLWRDRGPYGSISFGVLIDQQTGYLYCNTGWSTMCIDLNKTPKK